MTARFPGRLAFLAAAFFAAVGFAAALPTARAAAPESTLAQVLHRGVVRVATMSGNPPWEFVQPDGSLAGYDIDIAHLIGKALGVKVDFLRTNDAGRVAALEAHKADITIATFTPTLKRLTTLAFTDAYAVDGIQLLVLADSKFNTMADLDHPSVSIGLNRGSTTMTVIPQHVSKARIVQLSGIEDLLQALDSRQVDAVASNNGVIMAAAKSGPSKYRLVGPLLGKETDAIGLPQGDFPWWLWLNSFVHQINSDGTNYVLYKKWFGIEPPAFMKPPGHIGE